MSNKEIVKREFLKKIKTRYPAMLPYLVHVFEAPAAEAWVIIADGVAWVADGTREEFVFWGPSGAEPVSFELPADWVC